MTSLFSTFCFIARQFFSRIYAILSVKYLALKICQCIKYDKYQVWAEVCNEKRLWLFVEIVHCRRPEVWGYGSTTYQEKLSKADILAHFRLSTNYRYQKVEFFNYQNYYLYKKHRICSDKYMESQTNFNNSKLISIILYLKMY